MLFLVACQYPGGYILYPVYSNKYMWASTPYNSCFCTTYVQATVYGKTIPGSSCSAHSSLSLSLYGWKNKYSYSLATLSKYVFYSTCSFCLCHLYPIPSRNYFVFYSFSISYIVRVLSTCVICTLSRLGILMFFIRLVFFFVALISRVASFFVVLSYPVSSHLICLPGFFSVWFFSDLLSMTT